MPIALSNALGAFAAKRAEILNIEVPRMREATNVLNAYVDDARRLTARLCVCVRYLASVNLPAAIEDSGGRQMPPSLIEKANELKRQGGNNALERMVNELPNALSRNREILDEVRAAR